MAACSEEGCKHEAYEGDSKCILHCDKGEYGAEFPAKLARFYSAIIKEIVAQVFELESESGYINRQSLIRYLEGKEMPPGHPSDTRIKLRGFLKDMIITLPGINFPAWDSRDSFNYTKLFAHFKGVHFDMCKFSASSVGLHEYLSETAFFFQDCEFNKAWHIENLLLLENVNAVLFQRCNFHQDASAYFDDDIRNPRNRIDAQLFNNCNFSGELSFHRIEFKAPIFNNTDDEATDLAKLRLTGCILNEDAKFVLNHCRLNAFTASDTVFNSKVEFKENTVASFELVNSNFLGIFDAYETRFRDFSVYKSIFEDFTGFEKCEFGEMGNNAKELMPVFMYATFTSFVAFRGAKFHGGLDIQHTNLEDPPNFLDATINPVNSNRETFRIIKNSFDKIGNHIEANRFYALEMKKYREELRSNGKWQERFLLFLNEGISEFGQNYWRPVFLMVSSAFIYYGLDTGYRHNALYTLYPPANDAFRLVSDIANGMAKSVMPISRFLRDGMEFVSLVFYVVYATLIWQTLVAIKRHTKR